MPPYKDPAKRAEMIKNSHAKCFPVINIRISKQKEDVYNALYKAASDRNITAAEYMRNATETQLRIDGYLNDNDEAP